MVGGADAWGGRCGCCTGDALIVHFVSLLVDVLATCGWIGNVVEGGRDDRLGITEWRRAVEKIEERFFLMLGLGCSGAALVFTVGIDGIGIFETPLFAGCLRRLVEAGWFLGQGRRTAK